MQTLLLLITSLVTGSCSAAPPTTVSATAPAPAEAENTASVGVDHASAGQPDSEPVSADAAEFDHSHAALTRVLRPHVHDGLVDYRGLRQQRAGLNAYLSGLESVTARELKSWSDEQRFAFWINAYNGYTLQLVVEHYPVKSIKDIGGMFSSVWDKEFISLGSLYPKGPREELSLNHIEHDILRPVFADARVHAAVNCASMGCPALASEAFEAERLDEQLDAVVRAWIADSSKNRFEPENNAFYISKIFDWFEKDFTQDGGDVRKWIAQYAAPDVAEWLGSSAKLKTRYLDYSWKLNDVPK